MRGKFGSSTSIASLNTGADQVFHDAGDLVFVQERGFDIDLGEFRLAVGAQVFVAEALGDLVVAGRNRQPSAALLEQLRRLRQGEELTVVDARRNQIVTERLPASTWSASAFRCR